MAGTQASDGAAAVAARGSVLGHATGDNPILSVRSLSKAYPGVQALDALDLDVRRGEIHGIVGQNGAGKSTLIRLLSGADEPDSG